MAVPHASFTLHHIFNLMLLLPLISSISRCFSTGRIYSEPDPCWLACLDRGMWLFSIKSTQKCILLLSSHALCTLQGKGPDPGWFWAHKRSSKGSVFHRIKSSAAFLAGGAEQFLPRDSPRQSYQTGSRAPFPPKGAGRSRGRGAYCQARREGRRVGYTSCLPFRDVIQCKKHFVLPDPPSSAGEGRKTWEDSPFSAREDTSASSPESGISLNPGGLRWALLWT